MEPDEVPSPRPSSILNFRDVGKTINQLLGSAVLRGGLLYRSARPDDASPQERMTLVDTYHIRSIIDLRSTTEHINQAKKHSKIVPGPAAVPDGVSRVIDTVKVKGIDYHEINLNGGAFARALLWKLTWSNLVKLMALMATGYRMQAIGILGREVMAPRGLIGLGKDSLDHCMTELQEILILLADSNNYPTLIHCTQGKDRTGLVILLVLLLLEIPLDAISTDYMASERELESEKKERMKEIVEVGLGEEFTGCPTRFVEEMQSHINEIYGGLGGYMKRIGIDEEKQKRIRESLLEKGPL
ncbi:protein-tyrosine phosphatase, partial [Lecanoromycetidae sp. Uapishka_2]